MFAVQTGSAHYDPSSDLSDLNTSPLRPSSPIYPQDHRHNILGAYDDDIDDPSDSEWADVPFSGYNREEPTTQSKEDERKKRPNSPSSTIRHNNAILRYKILAEVPLGYKTHIDIVTCRGDTWL